MFSLPSKIKNYNIRTIQPQNLKMYTKQHKQDTPMSEPITYETIT